MSWHVVHTKPRQEDVALLHLQRQGFECYLPFLHSEKIRRGKAVIVIEPMFPRYVFIQLDTEGQGPSWAPIRSTTGVVGLVRFGQRVARVEDALIALLKEREQLQEQQPAALFQAGETVAIMQGPLAGLQAVYQGGGAEQRSMILLELLSRPVQLQVETAVLRKSDFG